MSSEKAIFKRFFQYSIIESLSSFILIYFVNMLIFVSKTACPKLFFVRRILSKLLPTQILLLQNFKKTATNFMTNFAQWV